MIEILPTLGKSGVEDIKKIETLGTLSTLRKGT